ncbi:MAG: hypothetical protein F6J93_01690 [Oscillatoria sp. SIO1A7]|nr:hypothetical protein [Oscillatoria sp. SIO1A7]
MKATNSSQLSLQAARFVKLTGTVLILVSLLDLALLPIPLELGDPRWRLDLTTNLVQRGIVPMLGMALVFSGYAFENISGNTRIERKKIQDLNLWIFLISSGLGFIFLLLVPLHISNALAANKQAIAGFKTVAEQAEQQLEIRLQEQETQFKAILGDRQSLESFISTDQFTPEQLERLQEFKDDPEALQQQINALRDRAKKRIEEQRQESEKRSKTGTLKSSIRVGLTSLLLASCYITIGWTGLKSMSRRQKPRP